MPLKSHYAILGVARDETPAGIRAAYREAVRRTHPDYAGPQSAPAFEEIVEAHSVLSDPDRRRDYDEKLCREERDRREPGLPHPFARDGDPRSMFTDRDAAPPFFEASAEWPRRYFTGGNGLQAERSQRLSVEVVLTPAEAVCGGILSIGIPVHEICGVCGGTGREWLFSCSNCRGRGRLSRMHPLPVSIPPSLRLGVTFEALLEAMGSNNLLVKLRIRVSEQPW
jgi:molecular chaperone DnaJ